MHIKTIFGPLVLLLSFALGSCSESETEPGPEPEPEPEPEAEAGRWYSQTQVDTGTMVFADNCAQCHGDTAEGLVSDWRARLDDGSFPPPPLNGSAHAWHHPNSVLLQVINTGGAAFGGNMPAFENVLNEADKLAAIAYFQSYWNDEIYAQWQKMGGSN